MALKKISFRTKIKENKIQIFYFLFIVLKKEDLREKKKENNLQKCLCSKKMQLLFLLAFFLLNYKIKIKFYKIISFCFFF